MYSSALLLFMAVMASCAAWHDGEVVNERGIRHRTGFFSHERREYEDVISVTLYEGLIAPIGLRPGVFNLEVEFHSGDPFRMLVDKGKRTREKLEEIARFISKQSGQPVIRAAIRP